MHDRLTDLTWRDPLSPTAGAAGRLVLAAVLAASLWGLVWWARS